jgi:hypothetical protein
VPIREVTVTIPDRVSPVLFSEALIVKLSGVVPLVFDRVNQVSPSLAVQLRGRSFPQFVTLICGLAPAVPEALQLVGSTHRVAGNVSCVMVIILGEPSMPSAVTVTVSLRGDPVRFSCAVIVKLPGVLPLVFDKLSHVSFSAAVQLNGTSFPQLVTLIAELVPPAAGASQLAGVTHRAGGTQAWVTLIIFDPLTPVADTVTVPLRVAPVLFSKAVIMRFPGVLPLAGDILSQVSLSLAVHVNDALFPQLVT